jgi:hypothetical protein
LTTIEPRRRRRIRQSDKAAIFLTRQELAQRWRLSTREIIEREKRGVIRPFKFSYKVVRYKLEDILRVEEAAVRLP